MGIFGKSEARQQQKRLEALLATAMQNNPTSSPKAEAAFQAAVEGLRSEGPAAEEYVLSVASKGAPFPYILCLWQAIYDMGESIVPSVVHVMKTGRAESARGQAVMALGTFAQTASQPVRNACVQEVRNAARQNDDEIIRTTAEAMLKVLADKGIV